MQDRAVTGDQAERAAIPARVPTRILVTLVVMLALTTMLSQFFRTALAVIAPELIADLGLSSQMLGLANGGFFAALLVAQIGVGVFFDRVGVRLTVSAVSGFMVLGAALHAVSYSGEMLVLARVVTGLGCAASFMAALILVSQWFPRERWATALSWVFSLSQLGILAAGTPLALVTTAIGWRSAFAITAVLAAIVGVLFYLLVRDRMPSVAATSESAVQPRSPGAVEGLRLILRLPGILSVFALFGVAYAAVVTVSGLWAGPYLKDVHGLDIEMRGHVLTGMAIVQMLALLIYGPLDRVFNTRKWIVVVGATATLAVLIALAALPSPPLWLVLTLLMFMSGFCCYNPILLAHMRSHFPDHLAGRGATTGNIAQLLGSAGLPILTGFIPAFFVASNGYAPEAYRLIFAALAVTLGVGLAVYAIGSRDIKPRG
jgi:MFS family permease